MNRHVGTFLAFVLRANPTFLFFFSPAPFTFFPSLLSSFFTLGSGAGLLDLESWGIFGNLDYTRTHTRIWIYLYTHFGGMIGITDFFWGPGVRGNPDSMAARNDKRPHLCGKA